MKVDHTLPIQEWWKDRKEIINDEVGEKSRVFTAQQLIDLDCNFDQCKFPKEEEEILPPAELLKQEAVRDNHTASTACLKTVHDKCDEQIRCFT